MKKILGVTVAHGLIVLALCSLFFQQPDYSYHAYRQKFHISVPSCLMDGSKVDSKGVILCAEDGRLPNGAEMNVWDGYVLWLSCVKGWVNEACQEMKN